DSLNLDAGQQKEVAAGLKTSSENIDLRIKETYIWLLVPTQEGTKLIRFERHRLAADRESLIKKAQGVMTSNELLITRWAAVHIRKVLDDLLWKDRDHIGIDELWKMLCQYCYLPRLKDRDVLLNAIRQGLSSTEYFAYAEGVSGSKYLGLRIGETSPDISNSGLLVKPEVALALLAVKEEPEGPITGGEIGEKDKATDLGKYREPIPASQKKGKRLYASFVVDPVRMNRDAGNIFEHLVSLLSEVKDAAIEVSIDIHAVLPEGIDESIERIIKENGRTLGATSIGIEEVD
ncbi:MAG TPA: hypothetical protein PLW63_02645, partial [Bacillota bacterium]|nr:hypothetical protein [Bacillota bacterium]